MRSAAILPFVLLTACARGDYDSDGLAIVDASSAVPEATIDSGGRPRAATEPDAARPNDDEDAADAGAADAPATEAADATTTDAGSADSSTTDAATVADAGALDPELALPSPSGDSCSSPGSMLGCPVTSVCRIASPTGGRCESCTTCGYLGARCSTSDECDILFQCFRGKCESICRLGTYECGLPSDCVNVGHKTMGVCKP